MLADVTLNEECIFRFKQRKMGKASKQHTDITWLGSILYYTGQIHFANEQSEIEHP